MRVYGDLDMQDNRFANLTLAADTSFPTTTKEGRLVFYHNVLYISVYVGNAVSWLPLTNQLNTLLSTFDTPSDTWTINHNYDTMEVVVTVYDTNAQVILPDNVQLVSRNAAVVTFGTPTAGSALVIAKYLSL